MHAATAICTLMEHEQPPITRLPVIKGWGEWRNLDSKTTSEWMVRYWCSMERCGMLLGSDPCISSPTGTPCMF